MNETTPTTKAARRAERNSLFLTRPSYDRVLDAQPSLIDQACDYDRVWSLGGVRYPFLPAALIEQINAVLAS